MRRLLMHIPAMLLILFAVSCYSYRSVTVEGRYLSGRWAGGDAAAYRLAVDRYLARLYSRTPVAVINNRAVDLAGQGRFREAEILLREVVAEDPREPAVYNNLGVICEISGMRDEAFRMYAAACRIIPGNARFTKNFSSFADYRSNGE